MHALVADEQGSMWPYYLRPSVNSPYSSGLLHEHSLVRIWRLPKFNSSKTASSKQPLYSSRLQSKETLAELELEEFLDIVHS